MGRAGGRGREGVGWGDAAGDVSAGCECEASVGDREDSGGGCGGGEGECVDAGSLGRMDVRMTRRVDACEDHTGAGRCGVRASVL